MSGNAILRTPLEQKNKPTRLQTASTDSQTDKTTNTKNNPTNTHLQVRELRRLQFAPGSAEPVHLAQGQPAEDGHGRVEVGQLVAPVGDLGEEEDGVTRVFLLAALREGSRNG